MSLINEIINAYRGFATSMRKQLAQPLREEKLLIYVVLACFIGLVARVPGLMQVVENNTDPDITITNIIGSSIATTMFYGPIMMYIIAALSHLAAKIFKGQATFAQARLALFWSALVVAPVFLVFVGLRPVIPFMAFIALGNLITGILFVYCWGVCLSVAEKFTNPTLVSISIVTIFGLIMIAVRVITIS